MRRVFQPPPLSFHFDARLSFPPLSYAHSESQCLHAGGGAGFELGKFGGPKSVLIA